MRDLPFAVEGTGDLSEALLVLLMLPPGEMTGLELFLLKRPIVEMCGTQENEKSMQRSALKQTQTQT